MSEPPSAELDIEHLDDIAEAVRNGKCLLFLGAGVHRPPGAKPPESLRWAYPENQRPPIGIELARHLWERGRLGDTFPREKCNLGNLGRISMLFEIRKGRNALVKEILAAVDKGEYRGVVRQTKPSPALRALAEMPFPLVITTNYDQLFERALPSAKKPQGGIYQTNKPPKRIETTDIETAPDPSRPFIYKLHGDISQRDSLVVTDEDYIHFILRMSDPEKFHPIPGIFREHFKEWPTLFIGYSLLDYNMRVLVRTWRWQLDPAVYPNMYSVGPSPDPLVKYSYAEGPNRLVWFVVEDLWKFIPALYERVMKKPMPSYDDPVAE